ncbi:hypothetical protein SEPCBS119000_001415 [Sporothrix epigloea]|uniref:Hypercellular protein n=1 Tax=Sporothrix epigloea TaxID=1892477 RepID=A0ABP0DED9_9PEZI
MPRSDPFLPVSPAQVKVLVLPVGPVRRDRFASFLERLKDESVVQLRDVTADSRPNRNMFSPLAFPDGAIFYDLTTHVPQPSHLALCPFDLYREPLVILALADGAAIKNTIFGSRRQSAAGRSIEERNIRTLYQELEELRDTYTKVLVHRVLIFDYESSPDAPIHLPDEGMATVPPVAQSKRTTIKTIMADVSSLLLVEMNTLSRSFDALSYIESPGQGTGSVNHSSDNGGDDAASSVASRRNSHIAMPTHRSNSVGTGLSSIDRNQARMSMPVPFKNGSSFASGSAATTSGRSATPLRSSSGLSGSAFNPDDTGAKATDVASNSPSTDRASSPADVAESYRSQSQDRISVQGFGPGGLNERWRNKGKSRVTIVVASLYLQAGRWPDALKELIEGATVSRSINDHLWHGKALELIVVCLLLLSWAEIEFQVPSICLPPPEKGSAAQAAALALDAAAEKSRPGQPKWLRHLQQILPDLLERILGLYTRISGENLPPLPFSDVAVRFSNILTALHLSDGILNRPFLNMVVEGKYSRGDGSVSISPLTPRLSVTPSRALITTILFRAFPSSFTELLTMVDRIVILSGIAAVLGRLGYQRKKALVVRELMSVLIAGLVEARTRGAAEVGIHPAAGLVTPNSGVIQHSGHANGAAALDLAEGDIESGVDAFLGMLLKTYGVVEFQPSVHAVAAADHRAQTTNDSDAAVIARIREQATARLFGMPGNKLNLLRACINFSEALPDFAGVLKFSSDLLRTAGSGIAPGQRRDDAAPVITKEEQVRLVTNIAKTSNLSRRLGLDESLAAEYWDEFLLRGVKLESMPAACQPVAHTGSELPGQAAAARTSQDVDPFIHNSFLKPSEKAVAEQILVADEQATFRLTLQNPYDVEVDIESIRIETEGADFEAYPDTAVLGPYRTQIVKVSGKPRAAGALHITGAIVRVRGCRERRFPIFTQPWSPERPDKIKQIGVAPFAQLHRQPSIAADDSEKSHSPPPTSPAVATALQLAGGPQLKPERLLLNVIPAQPMVVIESTTLPQSSVMVLEGERQVFSVTLKNLSSTTAVDFLLFSFQDSTQAYIQAALGSRDATPAELYEYELILAKKQALRLRPNESALKTNRYIGPGETATFDFEILGKPGLTSGTIQVDYAYLGTAAGKEPTAKFYTRQVSLHLTVTVNASIGVTRVDVLPLHGDIPQPLWDRCRGLEKSSTKATESLAEDGYCLLLLDLRNAWPSQMRVELSGEDGIAITEHILPGNTNRVVIPLKRIYLEDPHASIPALKTGRQRQFVVSAGKISPDTERANREAFWYREKILDVLRGSWSTATSPTGNISEDSLHRRGSVELRSIRLTPRMIEAVKVDAVGIEVAIESAQSAPKSTRVVHVDINMQLRVRMTNRTAQPLYPTLRLMPALRYRPLNVALDFTRKLAWNGALQQTLPLLDAQATTEVRMGMTALCRGEFEITASVEETRLWVPPRDQESNSNLEEGNRPRSNTDTLLRESLLGPKERRIWHTRTPYHFIAVDAPVPG